ncbi:probable malonyl-CoA-acyl carrier protein transacylase, mitochondrial isoform X2 [Orussus abietinus]|uniref:probable malonyl-CoA-acyl carrier protein transacylase, mitochondrial isoform X2 n=1 Tax=Orussus abietinus TaxID=222816 RepID=UPI000625222E|nr:probable malonyl-CoA-acyl carrier protein transacylase, mitochondrial isoform X2 [Orussus abietinus]
MLKKTLFYQHFPIFLNVCRQGRHVGCNFSSKISGDGESNDIENESEVSKLLNDAATFDAGIQDWSTLPYPKHASKQLQGSHAVRVGPQEKLNRTEYNQPATVAVSLAAMEKIREERPQVLETCVGVAGYSVGELTALIFAGAMSLEQGIRLAGIRGTAMQNAAARIPQGMMSVICSSNANISDICKKAQSWALDSGANNPLCRIAIYLYPQGKILAGNKEALDFIKLNGRHLGLRNLKNLSVSGAFHTSLMEPAVKPFIKALHNVPLQTPAVPVYSNVTGKCYGNAQHISKMLPKQIVSPVKWEQIMHILYERPPGTPFPRTFDVGSGGTMKTILKLVNAKAWDNCYIV